MMLWRIDGTRTHLLGSVHCLDATDYPIGERLEAIYGAANCVAFEADRGKAEGKIYGRLPNDRPLSDFDPDLHAELVNAFANLNIDGSKFLRFEPWIVGLFLLNGIAQERGLKHTLGLDAYFAGRVSEDKRNTLYLEEVEDGLRCFQVGGWAKQAAHVRYLIRERAYVVDLLGRIVSAWRNFCIPEMEQIQKEQIQRFPDMHRCMTVDRNRIWMPKIIQLLDSAEPSLICVGALHCVGADGLPKLLEKSGFSVSPIT